MSDSLLQLAAFKQCFLTFPQPALVVNAEGVVCSANSAFCEVFSAKTEDILTQGLDSLLSLDVAGVRASEVLREGWTGLAVVCVGQKIPSLVQVCQVLVPENEPLFLLIFSRDSVLSRPAEAFQKQKLESIGVLASSIAHDLNNLLTGVLGHVSYLRLSGPENSSQRDSIRAIEDGARKAASLTQQILEFARGEELQLRTVNLSLVVAAGANLLRASLPEKIILSVEEQCEDIYVYGDEGQLSQLVMNLTINARDALPDGGTVLISLSEVHLTEHVQSPVDVALAPGDYALLSVSDNGHGIPQVLLERIFEPFFTTKRERGNGLGLATVHSIVKAHRGAITVKSKEGEGTRFDVYLPLSGETEVALAGTGQSSVPEELLGGTEKILVVDDEEAVRIVMERSLAHLGYEVVVAESGEEALCFFRENCASFALVIIDMIMPQMTGDELFYELKKVDSSAKVLIASGYSSDSRTRAILDDGAVGFIQKPFAVEELACEVRRCLDIT